MRLEPNLHKIKKLMQDYNLMHRPFLLMVSGGKDSMALLSAFVDLKQYLNINFKVLHVHHGEDTNADFRKQTKALVLDVCNKYNISFYTNENLPKNLKSEESLRDYRKQICDETKSQGDIIVTAHHQRDQFETRLMRLIRGCGPEGLISMQIFKEDIFRPLLAFSLLELDTFYTKSKLDFLVDPSNTDASFFRNWLRLKWLPQLEEADMGSMDRFSQSLANIAETWTQTKDKWQIWFEKDLLKRQFLLDLDFSHQLQVLSLFLRENGVFSYQRGQLEEILKRLDNRQNNHTFNMLNCLWQVDETKIRLVKTSDRP